MFLVCGYLGKRKIDRWKEQNGYRPVPSFRRDLNADYKRQLWRDLPSSIQRKFWLLVGFGFSCLVAGIILAN
jgi:hypothetical protein